MSKSETVLIMFLKSISFSQLITGSGDSTCAIWDVESLQMIQSFHGHVGDIFALDAPKADTSNIFITGVCDLVPDFTFKHLKKGF